MYRGHHRACGKLNGLALGITGLAITCWLVTAALAPIAALGKGRPRECTGVPPTAVTIEQTVVAPDPSTRVRYTYLVSSGAAFNPGAIVATGSLTVASGQSLSLTLNALSKGDYTVRQEPDPASGVAPEPDQTVSVSPPSCVSLVSYTSIIEPN